MTKSDLLPCPFCSGAAREIWPGDKTYHYIKCDACGCRTATHVASHGGSAKDDWNRRPSPADFGPDGDWDVAAHVRLLRAGGGPSSGYTADLIERLHAALAASEIASLRQQLADLRCPIGLDDAPSLCSAGYCRECLGRRLAASEQQIEESRERNLLANARADNAQADAAKARALALEQAAQVVESFQVPKSPNEGELKPRRYPSQTSVSIAAAIRKLAEPDFQYCDGCDGYNCDSEKGCAYPETASAAEPVAWKKVPTEATNELLADASSKQAGDKQVLCYENGAYYNAWLVFEEYEGGWIWMNEADSEPNPSHYMALPAGPEVTP